MALTWRDVAGGVRAPDTSEVASLITQGLTGLKNSVSRFALRNETAQRDQALNELQNLGVQAKVHEAQAADTEDFFKNLKVHQEKEAQKEFSTAWSSLEAGARDAALQGKSFEDFAKNNEIYNGLSEDARAFGAQHLSDAFYQGIGLRDQRMERAQNNRIQEAQLALSRHAQARADRESDLRIKALEKAQRDARENDPYRFGAALGDFTQRVASNLRDAGGFAYEDQPLSKIAKEAGIEDTSMATNIYNRVNAYRKGLGKDPLPEGVLKSLIAGQSGKNDWFGGAWTTFDESQFEADLGIRADMYDAAQMENQLLKGLRGRAKGGEVFTTDLVQQELARLNPPKPIKVAPASVDDALKQTLDPRSMGSSQSYRSY